MFLDHVGVEEEVNTQLLMTFGPDVQNNRMQNTVVL